MEHVHRVNDVACVAQQEVTEAVRSQLSCAGCFHQHGQHAEGEDRGTVAGRGRQGLMTTVWLLKARSQQMQQCRQALPGHESPDAPVVFAWSRRSPPSAAAAEGPAEVGPNGPSRSRPNLAASARRPAATRPARPTGTRDRALARFVGSTGGGDADPDPTLACSRAAHRGGLDVPLRRLTTIPDRRSWRRDLLAGPTTTEDPISRRSVVVYGLDTKCGERPRSPAVRCVCHLTPQCSSSRRSR